MKNDEFRKLVTAARQDDGSPPQQSMAQRALGGKKSSFAGMTPRPGKAVSNADFARQIRERHASLQPAKKFKSSAPKGSKFAAGYTDRAKARQEAEEEEDDKAKRISALEEQVKLGQLSQETFEALRDQILGGDASSTHLVKGLDRKLLERVRRGEDVLGLGAGKDGTAPPDVDEELDKLEEKDVEAVAREKTEKKGTKASQTAGVKRTRDEIMADLKAQRKAAAEAKAAAAPAFDSRWRRIGDPAKPKIEIDAKGREVLISVDENGVVKKKIRKVAADSVPDSKTSADIPDASKPVLGADVAVPEQPIQQPESEDDDDIFEGAGTEYNPLGDVEDDSDDDETDEDVDEKSPKNRAEPSRGENYETGQVEKKPEPDANTGPPSAPAQRNYFKVAANDSKDAEQDRFKGIENVLKKAAQIGAKGTNENDDDSMSKAEREARAAKHAKMLAQQDRDLEDMDMGFGSSRFEDEEGAADKKTRLSKWKNNTTADDDGWDEDENEGEAKKKRKGKKRKGDANNVDDIMKVIEGRKAAAGSK
ncbi:hypothetical protein M409DRAFT_48741 [Zasmidium cellare ATCC 36951]|uniref:RED-like N-terminal domain-containing protein n=1 Tax=Zasmidium cellare ATCC 36951 TaxID=1080233 RepID=A0A6A6D6N0_ZASCE|nr:uncharacterized protein M409DRAFT_48741 [Zasmidium cellare ATCC 36951]KAF2173819.1 hypothetical protein M409DRAFT_48741 [Zasmidium cellare ATCC 36951]